jgi:hypothetical protein
MGTALLTRLFWVSCTETLSIRFSLAEARFSDREALALFPCPQGGVFAEGALQAMGCMPMYGSTSRFGFSLPRRGFPAEESPLFSPAHREGFLQRGVESRGLCAQVFRHRLSD